MADSCAVLMADDTVAEAPFCVACRRSSAVKWRKHVFSRGHQRAAQQFLLLQASRLQELCDAATSGSVETSKHWRCVFCDAAWATSDALTHFGGETHKKQVESFCRHHRCDADRHTRPQLWLQAARRRELEALLRKSEAEEQKESQGDEQEKHEKQEADQAASERVEAFLSSAASRLQEVHSTKRAVDRVVADVQTREQQLEALLGPQLAQLTAPRRCKTVTSPEGVLQNPLGRHEDRRVWGGGIVKLRKAEWIPWAIDQLVKEEQAENADTQQPDTDSTAFAHRVTELARGEGLSSIAAVSWGASVGNVHTAAVPPWMVQSEDEYKKCNRREQAAPAPTNDKTHDKKRRDIFSELQAKSEYGPDWLPNFGGVWQEGPRSKTKQAFRITSTAAKASRNKSPAGTTEPRPSQIPVQPTIEAVPPPPPLLSSQPPVVRHIVPAEEPPKPHETPVIPPQEPCTTRATKETAATNPLDEKKQSLLAQKERLRAKMAARRRH